MIPSKIIMPPSLLPGDTIAICAPAGAFDHSLLLPAIEAIERKGYNVRVMPHSLGRCGTYSGSAEERLSDLTRALTDPDIQAVMCARGGYGMTHLLESLSLLPLEENPKWVIGFSDISALHALLLSKGIASIHASMLKGLVRDDVDSVRDAVTLFGILRGHMPKYEFAPNEFNRTGTSHGRIVGGNLAVLQALIGTPYDIFQPGINLFIEDLNEPVYKIDRVLWQLRHMGILGQLNSLIVGQFSNCREDANGISVYQTIARIVEPYSYPVAMGVDIGHVEHNVPIIEGAVAKIDVNHERTMITF